MRRRTPHRWQTAVHEAGHAVTAMLLGMPVRWMCCDVEHEKPDGGVTLGFVNYSRPRSGGRAEGRALAWALTHLAGDVAESLYTGRRIKGAESWYVAGLYNTSEREVRALGPRIMRRATEVLLRQKWASVIVLAHELNRRGRMTGGFAHTYLGDRGVPVYDYGHDYAQILVDSSTRALAKCSIPPAQLQLPGVQ